MEYSQKQIHFGAVSTSEREIKDILKAWIAVSAAFAIVLSASLLSFDLYVKFIVASLTVGIGFLLHELGHKVVAQKYGCFAEFRSFDAMLLLAIGMSFFGFVFAAPGAVMISGRATKSRSGIISAAGPLVNFVLALVFLLLAFLQLPDIFRQTALYGFMINSWLGLFNLIPAGLFDGYKILKWSKLAYGILAVVGIVLVSVQHFMHLPV